MTSLGVPQDVNTTTESKRTVGAPNRRASLRKYMEPPSHHAKLDKALKWGDTSALLLIEEICICNYYLAGRRNGKPILRFVTNVRNIAMAVIARVSVLIE